MNSFSKKILKNPVARETLIGIGIYALIYTFIIYRGLNFFFGYVASIYLFWICYLLYIFARVTIWAIKTKRLAISLFCFISFLLVVSYFSAPSIISFIPWTGKVVDKQTGQTIQNAVIVRSWNAIRPDPVEGAREVFLTLEEKLTDTDGRFNIFKKTFHLSTPFLFSIFENQPFIYKPGYKSIFLAEKPSVIYLERVPTIAEIRKFEAEKTRDQYVFYFGAATILSQMVENEQDFIENGMKKPEPIKTITESTSNFPFQNHPADRSIFLKESKLIISGGAVAFGSGTGDERFDDFKNKHAVMSLKTEDLLKLLQEKNCATRSAACSALEGKNDSATVPQLMDILIKGHRVRVWVI